MKPTEQQPYGIEVHECDGLFLKQMFIPKRMTFVPQHSHVWDHLSMLVRGGVRVWEVADDEHRAPVEYFAPKGILIKAGVKHLFLSLVDDTEIWCVHNLHGAAAVKILEEHQLVDEVT